MTIGREHLWNTMTMAPTFAYNLWLSSPYAQTAWDIFVDPLSSQNFAANFHANPWCHITMPHEDFATAIIADQLCNSDFH